MTCKFHSTRRRTCKQSSRDLHSSRGRGWRLCRLRVGARRANQDNRREPKRFARPRYCCRGSIARNFAQLARPPTGRERACRRRFAQACDLGRDGDGVRRGAGVRAMLLQRRGHAYWGLHSDRPTGTTRPRSVRPPMRPAPTRRRSVRRAWRTASSATATGQASVANGGAATATGQFSNATGHSSRPRPAQEAKVNGEQATATGARSQVNGETGNRDGLEQRRDRLRQPSDRRQRDRHRPGQQRQRRRRDRHRQL